MSSPWARVASVINAFTPPAFRSLLPPGWAGDRAPYGPRLSTIATVAGITVTSDKALGYHPVWRAVNLLAGDTARTPLYVYRRVGRGKALAPDHPAFRLLRYRPNPRQSADTMREMLMGHSLLRGNGYCFVERDQFATPVALWPLDPVLCRPIILNASNAGPAMKPAGTLVLEYQSQNRGVQYLPMEDILHIAGLGYDGLQGYDVVTYLANTLGYGLAAQSYGERYFSQAATPRGVLMTDGVLDDQAARKLAESWNASNSGLSAAHRTALLEGGIKFQPISFNAKDSQMLEVLQENIVAVANIFGIPAAMLGKQTGSVYSTLEANLQSYLAGALEKWLVRWEMECREKLLTEDEKRQDSIVIEFDRSRIVVLSTGEKVNYLRASLSGHPWESVNEGRDSVGLNPIDDPKFDTIQVPTNNFAPSGAAFEPDTNAERAAVVECAARLRDEAARRMRRRLAHQAKRHRGKPEALAACLAGMDADNRATIEEALAPSVDMLTRLRAGTGTAASAATELIYSTRQRLTAASASLETFDAAIAELES